MKIVRFSSNCQNFIFQFWDFIYLIYFFWDFQKKSIFSYFQEISIFISIFPYFFWDYARNFTTMLYRIWPRVRMLNRWAHWKSFVWRGAKFNRWASKLGAPFKWIKIQKKIELHEKTEMLPFLHTHQKTPKCIYTSVVHFRMGITSLGFSLTTTSHAFNFEKKIEISKFKSLEFSWKSQFWLKDCGKSQTLQISWR